MTLKPSVMAIAEAQAAGDRALLAHLVATGQVARRNGDYERRHPRLMQEFAADIETRAGFRRPPVNLAIRPKKRRR